MEGQERNNRNLKQVKMSKITNSKNPNLHLHKKLTLSPLSIYLTATSSLVCLSLINLATPKLPDPISLTRSYRSLSCMIGISIPGPGIRPRSISFVNSDSAALLKKTEAPIYIPVAQVTGAGDRSGKSLLPSDKKLSVKKRRKIEEKGGGFFVLLTFFRSWSYWSRYFYV